MPPSQLRERLTSMLDWLVEERFVRDDAAPMSTSRPRGPMLPLMRMKQDDTVPTWATSAHHTKVYPGNLNGQEPSLSHAQAAPIQLLRSVFRGQLHRTNRWLGSTGR